MARDPGKGICIFSKRPLNLAAGAFNLARVRGMGGVSLVDVSQGAAVAGGAGEAPSKLVWMDLEMTGLDPARDTILEIATLITDSELNIVAEGPEIVVRQPLARLQAMDAWNREHHGKSGLWDKVLASTVELAQAEARTLDFIRAHVGAKESPLCGNSIWQDRRFLAVCMPDLDAYLHYRLIDVSTIKELVSRWYPAAKYGKKKGNHRALDDIRESLDELRHYRATVFIAGKGLGVPPPQSGP